MKELSIEDIVLKDLSARLPWSVKVLTPNDQEAYTLLALHPNKNIAVIGFEMDGMYVTSKVKIDDCKPLLRPMSDMTEEEKKEYHQLEQDIIDVALDDEGYEKSLVLPYFESLVDFYNSHHFDYRFLIEQGFAIAVTEENNPYKAMEE